MGFGRVKAQVTAFIVAAILIVALVSFFFILSSDSEGSLDNVDSRQVKDYIQGCLEDVSEEVVFKVLSGGGYYYPPENSTDLGIPYYYNEEGGTYPSLDKVESEIALYVEGNMLFCLGNYEKFNEYDLTLGELDASVDATAESVEVVLDYPVTVRRGGSVDQMKNFEYDVPARAGVLYDAIRNFVSEDVQADLNRSNSQLFCMSCLNEISASKDIKVEISSLRPESDVFVFSFVDNQSLVNNRQLRWTFANDY